MRDHSRTPIAGVVVALVACVLCVGCSTEDPSVSLEVRLVEVLPADSLMSVPMAVWGGELTYYAHREVLLTENDVMTARMVREKGAPAIEIVFSDEARDRLLDVTQNNIGRRLGVIIDGHLVCAAQIDSPNDTGVVLVTGQIMEPAAIRCSRALTRI